MSRLEELVNSGAEVYIVWTTVNEPLGYLVPFDDLKERFRVESLDATDNSELLLITGARTGDG